MDYKVAEITTEAINKISECEKELKSLTDKDIVLIAYQKTDNNLLT